MHRPLLLTACLLASPSLGQELKLPLALGYYVETGIACSDADEASLALLHDSGITTRFGRCSFEGLSDGGDGIWSYAASCGGGEELGEIETQGQITVKSETAFNIANGEQELDYSFCAKEELPAQYRTP